MKPNWPVALSLFAAALASYAIYYHFSKPLKALAGELQILDMRGSGYTLAEARQLLEQLGEDGRRLYGRTTLLDTLWPVLLGISSIFMAALTFRSLRLVGVAAFLPVTFGVLDRLLRVHHPVEMGCHTRRFFHLPDAAISCVGPPVVDTLATSATQGPKLMRTKVVLLSFRSQPLSECRPRHN
jgi:hypothetical protein